MIPCLITDERDCWQGPTVPLDVLPREGETLLVDGHLLRVVRVVHAINTSDASRCFAVVETTRKPAPQPHKRRARFEP
jgi:hypothetical protein